MTNKTHKNGNTTTNSELIKALRLSLESVSKQYLLSQFIQYFELDNEISKETELSIKYLAGCIPLMSWELAELDNDFDDFISKYSFKESDMDEESESVATFLVRKKVVDRVSFKLIKEIFPFENSNQLFQRFLDFLPKGTSAFQFIDADDLEAISYEILGE